MSLKKILNDGGIGSLIAIAVGIYIAYSLYQYFSSRGGLGLAEKLSSNRNPAYAGSGGMNPSPANPSDLGGGSGGFADASGIRTSTAGMPTTGGRPTITDPAELLPRDGNSDWSKLNPPGQGDLGNMNMLKAGYHIGIDTIGSTMKNPNLQLRSEPPNPQINSGPWNQPTIQPDFMRPTLEIGQGMR